MISSAYQVQALQKLGIEIAQLGCVMLEFDQIPIKDWIPEDWAYHTENPKYFWINGLDVASHVTLLYGLLEKAFIWREHVDEVLDGWRPGAPYISYLDYFPSPIEGEDYDCIIAHIGGDNLLEAHQRLSFLPHINTHAEYKPHITLGYVKSVWREAALDSLKYEIMDHAARRHLNPKSLNYGDQIL